MMLRGIPLYTATAHFSVFASRQSRLLPIELFIAGHQQLFPAITIKIHPVLTLQINVSKSLAPYIFPYSLFWQI
jgi:hypothetical protein